MFEQVRLRLGPCRVPDVHLGFVGGGEERDIGRHIRGWIGQSVRRWNASRRIGGRRPVTRRCRDTATTGEHE